MYQFASHSELGHHDRDLSRAASERYFLLQSALDRRREASLGRPAGRPRRRFSFGSIFARSEVS